MIAVDRETLSVNIQLVVFDLFGTLVQTAIGQKPYRKVLEWARKNGRAPQPDDARTIMTLDVRSDMLFAAMGIDPPPEIMASFKESLEMDIRSIQLFDDTLNTIRSLTGMGVSVAICSNLAKPYSVALDLLEGVDHIRFMSFEIGAIKPERKIYSEIVDRTGIRKANTLFVGDSLASDYIGPKEFGFHARHLVRVALSKPCSPPNHQISSLNEIEKMLTRP